MSNFLTQNKMKKITLIIFTVFLNAILFSCTDEIEEIVEQETNTKVKYQAANESEECCGEEEDIIP